MKYATTRFKHVATLPCEILMSEKATAWNVYGD